VYYALPGYNNVMITHAAYSTTDPVWLNNHHPASVRNTSLASIMHETLTSFESGSKGDVSRLASEASARETCNSAPYISNWGNIIECLEQNTLFIGYVNPPFSLARAYLSIESLCRTCHIVAAIPTAVKTWECDLRRAFFVR